MSSLESTFAELRARLKSVDRLEPARADPLYHVVHPPEQTAELMRALPRWRVPLQQDGWQVRIHSLADAMWSVIDASGRWDDWLEQEPDAEPGEIIGAVRDALQTKAQASAQASGQASGHASAQAAAGLPQAIKQLVSRASPDTVLLLTDAALLHPFFRVRSIEDWVRDALTCPAVFFYPGTKHGQFGLRFLGFYEVDPNYRSNIIGGAGA
jgi:hypothetical protein